MSQITILYTTYSEVRPPTVMTGCILAETPDRLKRLIQGTPVEHNTVMGVKVDLDVPDAVPIFGVDGLYCATRSCLTTDVQLN